MRYLVGKEQCKQNANIGYLVRRVLFSIKYDIQHQTKVTQFKQQVYLDDCI